MQETQVTVANAAEHEFELATLVVQTSSQFSSQIHIQVEGKKVNGKSIMGMTYLALMDGDLVTISAEGPDAADAVEALSKLLKG